MLSALAVTRHAQEQSSVDAATSHTGQAFNIDRMAKVLGPRHCLVPGQFAVGNVEVLHSIVPVDVVQS